MAEKPKRKKSLARTATQIIIVLVAFLAIRTYLQSGTLTRGPAPQISGVLLDGSEFSLESLRGEAVLVHFWATWCKICALNDGAIDDLARDLPVITVAMESGGTRALREEMEERGLSFPVMVDGLGKIANQYRVKGVPTNFILDPKGNIRFVEVGYTTGLGLRLRLWLASL